MPQSPAPRNNSNLTDREYVTVAGSQTVTRRVERDPRYWWEGFKAGAWTIVGSELAILFLIVVSMANK